MSQQEATRTAEPTLPAAERRFVRLQATTGALLLAHIPFSVAGTVMQSPRAAVLAIATGVVLALAALRCWLGSYIALWRAPRPWLLYSPLDYLPTMSAHGRVLVVAGTLGAFATSIVRFATL